MVSKATLQIVCLLVTINILTIDTCSLLINPAWCTRVDYIYNDNFLTMLAAIYMSHLQVSSEAV